jgi:hypothetical protein
VSAPAQLPSHLTNRAALAELEQAADRAEARQTTAERFGWPHEQAADREVNITSLPADVQASIREADLAYDLATEARSYPSRANIHCD